MTFSAGLNGRQVDKENRESASRRSKQTRFVASKLVTTCSCAYSPPSMLSHCRHPQALYTQWFSPSSGLNGLQVDQVNEKNDSQTSTYTQFGCGLTIYLLFFLNCFNLNKQL